MRLLLLLALIPFFLQAQDWGTYTNLNPSFNSDNRFNATLDLSGTSNTTPDVPEWTQDLILYQMRIDKFGALPTINSAKEHLHILSELGVTGVVLNPVAQPFKWPNGNHEEWSYYTHLEPNILDPDLGTEADFTAFVDSLHAMGIKVFLDFEFHGVFDRNVFLQGPYAQGNANDTNAYNAAGPNAVSSLITSHPEFFETTTDAMGTHIRYTAWNSAELMWRYTNGTVNTSLMNWFKNMLINDWIIKYNLDGLRLDLEPYEVANEVGYNYWESLINEVETATGRKIILIPEDGNAQCNNAFAFAQENFGVDNPRFGQAGSHVKDFMVSENLTNYPTNQTNINNTVAPINIVDEVKDLDGDGYSRTETYYSSCISSHDKHDYPSQGHLVYFGYGMLFQPFIPFWFMGNEFNASKNVPAGSFYDILYNSRINWNDYTTNQDHYNAVRKMIYIRKKYKNLIGPSTHQLNQKAMVKIDVVGSQPDLPGYGYYNNLTQEKAGIIVLGTKETPVNNITIRLPIDQIQMTGHTNFIFHNLLTDEQFFKTATNISGGFGEVTLENLPAWENLIYVVEPDYSYYYKVEIKSTGKCFDIAGYSHDDGALIHQWDYNTTDNQLWRLEPAPDNKYFYMFPKNAVNKAFEMGGWSTEIGGQTIIWEKGVDQANQQWFVVDAGNNYYRIVNKHSGLSLDVEGNLSTNGAKIWQWNYTNSDNQKFKPVARFEGATDPFLPYLHYEPVCNITTPTNTQEFVLGDFIQIDVDATKQDGTIDSVQFIINNNVVYTDITAPYQYVMDETIYGIGNYTISSVAYGHDKLFTNSNQISISITAANQAPTCTLVNPTDGLQIHNGETIFVNALASDNDGTIDSVQFYIASTGLFYTAYASPYEISFPLDVNVPAGNYDFYAIAYDNDGDFTQSATHTVTLIQNLAPVCTINTPVNNAIYTQGDIIPFDVTATDDGTLDSVVFVLNTTSFANFAVAPYQYNLPTDQNSTIGTYNFYAIAYDNYGLVTYSDTNQITLELATNTSIVNNKKGFSIFPNPANTYLQVKSENLKGKNIEALDITGKVVKQVKSNKTQEIKLDISDLQNGVYFIKIGTQVQKFIKE